MLHAQKYALCIKTGGGKYGILLLHKKTRGFIIEMKEIIMGGYQFKQQDG